MTAHAMKGDRERCLAAGMDGYVSKPIHPQELFEAVASLTDHDRCPGPISRPGVSSSSQAIFDRAAALEFTDGDEELLNDLVRTNLDIIDEQLAELRTAFGARDEKTLRRVAHTIKG